MYQALGYQAVELDQYYLTNRQAEQKLLKAPLSPPNEGHAKIKSFIMGVHDFPKTQVPYKTPLYFENRFLKHPFYDYKVWVIADSLIIATRVASAHGSNVLRIVDMAGDVNVLAESGSAWVQLMQEHNAEYLDLWAFGIDPSVLQKAGFRKVDADAGDIVANFFEPYLAKTGRIPCVFKSKSSDPWLICRADGDQDRPNKL